LLPVDGRDEGNPVHIIHASCSDHADELAEETGQPVHDAADNDVHAAVVDDVQIEHADALTLSHVVPGMEVRGCEAEHVKDSIHDVDSLDNAKQNQTESFLHATLHEMVMNDPVNNASLKVAEPQCAVEAKEFLPAQLHGNSWAPAENHCNTNTCLS
jgi:hypothetical protein